MILLYKVGTRRLEHNIEMLFFVDRNNWKFPQVTVKLNFKVRCSMRLGERLSKGVNIRGLIHYLGDRIIFNVSCEGHSSEVNRNPDGAPSLIILAFTPR